MCHVVIHVKGQSSQRSRAGSGAPYHLTCDARMEVVTTRDACLSRSAATGRRTPEAIEERGSELVGIVLDRQFHVVFDGVELTRHRCEADRGEMDRDGKLTGVEVGREVRIRS